MPSRRQSPYLWQLYSPTRLTCTVVGLDFAPLLQLRSRNFVPQARVTRSPLSVADRLRTRYRLFSLLLHNRFNLDARRFRSY